MVNRLLFPTTLAHIDDMRRRARCARIAEAREDRGNAQTGRVRRVGPSYRLPSGRWIHGTP